MKITLHPNFTKAYKKRISNNPNLITKTKQRIMLFQKDPNHPLLKNHPLKGSKSDLRSFSITGDIRIVYLQISIDHVTFLDIGTHNQVY